MRYCFHAPRDFGIGFGFIVAFAFFGSVLRADGPPADLIRRVAAREASDEEARNSYTWRQTFVVEEFDSRGLATGRYRETRDILFSPEGKRTEQLTAKPSNTLRHISLTDEDFADLRDVQPLLLTTERLFMYESRFKGDEAVDGVDCWVIEVRPRQILAGQRLFDGLIWVDQKDYAIVRSQGVAVPQERGGKRENLFPRFTTTRQKIDGHWFPVSTLGDDTLYYRSGPQRERLSVRYENYKRFSAESTIHFEQ
jgi:hypothetical protein